MMTCVCGSTKDSTECCARYISGEQLAPDAESLMRSRYTAYTQANIAYIANTMRGPALASFNPHTASEWAKQIKWLRLQVLKFSTIPPEEDKAYVEFVAHYLFQGQKEKLHEISEFQRIDGQWYYVDGHRL
ncbi:MAG: putative motif domain protein [Gammaproteobacteria bacterium]|jgi:SEC-C motif-containing protein|nr:putative motif domain protein [Gammaproteobacteria bacterium]